MHKKDDSIRSLGFVTIASDKPTKTLLQRLADKEGVPLTEYLRVKAIELGREAGEAPMLPTSTGSGQLPTKFTRIMSFILVASAPWAYVEEFKKSGSIIELIERGEADLDTLWLALKAKLASMSESDKREAFQGKLFQEGVNNL